MMMLTLPRHVQLYQISKYNFIILNVKDLVMKLKCHFLSKNLKKPIFPLQECQVDEIIT